MLILKTLTRTPLHGYGIALSIKHLSDDVLTVEEGSLYRRCSGCCCTAG
jgi:PadR family transcriptional regulator, regulatory protein PadR